jgi:hypothetical protein
MEKGRFLFARPLSVICHSERSEESLLISLGEMFRYAQHDMMPVAIQIESYETKRNLRHLRQKALHPFNERRGLFDLWPMSTVV